MAATRTRLMDDWAPRRRKQRRRVEELVRADSIAMICHVSRGSWSMESGCARLFVRSRNPSARTYQGRAGKV